MKNLKDTGFLERMPRRGTFVKPGNDKGVIGFLVGARLAHEAAFFHRALFKRLCLETSSRHGGDWRCYLYDELNGLKTKRDFECSHTWQRLTNDLKNYPFKGFIQTSGAAETLRMAGLKLNAPTVQLGPDLPGLGADVFMDLCDFGRKSVEYLAGKGRRKIVYLRTLEDGVERSPDLNGIREAVRSLSLPPIEMCQLKGEWVGGGRMLESEACARVRQLVREWKARGEDGWPDALLISDDMTTRGAVMALVLETVKVPDRLFVLTAANEDVFHYHGIPVAKYEFPMGRMVGELLRVMERRMAGESPADVPVGVRGSVIESAEHHVEQGVFKDSELLLI